MSVRDFSEFIASLNRHRVRYLVIGGYAVAFHGHPRATDDLDVLIDRAEANVRRVEAALFDFAGDKPEPERLRKPSGMIRMGGPFVHIDLTTKVDGLEDFGGLWRRRERGEVFDQPTQYLSLRDLLRTKRASNRPKDLADIDALEQAVGAAARGRTGARATRRR